jgi:hypothetical protein
LGGWCGVWCGYVDGVCWERGGGSGGIVLVGRVLDRCDDDDDGGGEGLVRGGGEVVF